ncbi:MAG: hypothetical protein QOK15_2281, partial [Nocardioidaceae bacterium]|nr:hypothetical protein [Nocardioidaceae bacterium]
MSDNDNDSKGVNKDDGDDRESRKERATRRWNEMLQELR